MRKNEKEWKKMRISETNDMIRASLPFPKKPHRMVMTQGVRTLSAHGKRELIRRIQEFKDFNIANDPYEEHDTIFVDMSEKKYICKIDYYDDDFEGFQEDGNRVFTIMNASEY